MGEWEELRNWSKLIWLKFHSKPIVYAFETVSFQMWDPELWDPVFEDPPPRDHTTIYQMTTFVTDRRMPWIGYVLLFAGMHNNSTPFKIVPLFVCRHLCANIPYTPMHCHEWCIMDVYKCYPELLNFNWFQNQTCIFSILWQCPS